jgi:fibronectin type 3 domain-containing protein
MKNRQRYFFGFPLIVCVLLGACSLTGDGDSGSDDYAVTVTVSPSSVTLAKGTSQQFSATVTNAYSQTVTWSIEGNHAAATTISPAGLLTVAANESVRTFTVKATRNYYGDISSGTAAVTVALDGEIPTNLKVTRPGKTAVGLSWNSVTNVSTYKVYRSTNGKDYSHLASSSAASYTDNAVAAGSSYYYAVSAVVKGLETGKSSVSYSFAEEYFALPVFAGRRLVPLIAGQKHYYRFPVNAGESYTITWENGNSGNADYYVRCSAWQSDGTALFTNSYEGYTSPKVFTASTGGYVTVEIENRNSSTSYNYMAYCLRTNGETDTGVAALPPEKVSGFTVTSPGTSSISLSWNPVSGAVRYNMYRSTTQTGAAGLLGNSGSTAYTDSSVAAGASYYYTIAPVNADGREGVRVQGAFAFAASHYPLPDYSGSSLMNLGAGQKHYYRFSVNAGQGYMITWENGSSGNADYYVRCSAWQNDGTAIFTNSYEGYTSPKVFTASTGGYVTVEIENRNSSTSYNYKIYR